MVLNRTVVIGKPPVNAFVRIAKLEVDAVPYSVPPAADRWSPRTDMLGMTNDGTVIPFARPTGPGYVRWEDYLRAGETWANTNFNEILDRASDANLSSPKQLTIPEGVFTCYGIVPLSSDGATGGAFSYTQGGADVMIRWGSKGGGLGGLSGVTGSGWNSIIRNAPAGSSQRTKDLGSATPASGLVQVQMMLAQGGMNDGTSPERFRFENFRLRGEDCGHYHDGLLTYNDVGTVIRNVYVEGANPGWKNAPPGETMGVKTNNSRRWSFSDSDTDGRHWQTKVRRTAAVIGINNSDGIDIRRFFGHHADASMVTFYKSTNVYTEDCVVFTNGTEAGGGKNGAGFNHEGCWGRFEHVRPTFIQWGTYSRGTLTPELAALIPDRARSDAAFGSTPTRNNGIHVTMNVALADGRFMDPFIIRDPQFDEFDGQKVLCIRIQDEYPAGRTPTSVNGQTRTDTSGADPQVFNAAGERMEFRRRGGWFLNFTAAPAGGTFTIQIGNVGTAPIPGAASNAQIAAAINAVLPRETGSTGGQLPPVRVFNATNSADGLRKEIRFGKATSHTLTVSSALTGAAVTATPDRVGTAPNNGIDATKAFLTY